MNESNVLETQKATNSVTYIVYAFCIALVAISTVSTVLLTSRVSALEEYARGEFLGISYRLDELEQINNTRIEAEKATAQEMTKTNDIETSVSEAVVYNNAVYDFALTLPKEWKNVQVVERTLDWGSFGTGPSFDFGFEVQDSLFNVSIFTKSQWQGIKAQEGPSPTYLGENALYVFGYSTAQDSANTTMAERMSEVKEIVKTFTVSE